jgi:hypothetical protein
MNKLSSTDRRTLIRLASRLPKGSEERRAIVAGLSNTGRGQDRRAGVIPVKNYKNSGAMRDAILAAAREHSEDLKAVEVFTKNVLRQMPLPSTKIIGTADFAEIKALGPKVSKAVLKACAESDDEKLDRASELYTRFGLSKAEARKKVAPHGTWGLAKP